MNKEFYNKEDVLNNFKKVINKDFYESIVKANFIDEVIEMLSSKCIISLTIDDFLDVADGELVGTLSVYMNDYNDELPINIINDKKPSYCLLNFIASSDLSLEMISKIINRITSKYTDIRVGFGSFLNDEIKSLCKIQALFISKKGNHL